MSEFHFLRPLWLLAFLPWAVLGWRLLRRQRDDSDWRALCDPELLPHILTRGPDGNQTGHGLMLWGVGGALAILALAGPVWERLPAPALRNEAALVIALDLSRVMDAADIKPSRLARARFKVEDILRQRKDGLTALLVYSGDAYTVTPLTDDAGTIQAQLSALGTDLMPTQGSRADLALEHAARLLKQAGLTRGDILLITNAIQLDKAEAVAERLKGEGYRVSVLGAGGEEGAPVPLPEGGFLQTPSGEIVISKLAAPALRQLAERSGGLYWTLAPDNSDISALLAHFEQQVVAAADVPTTGGVLVAQWREQGPWLLLALLPIAALGFRRGLLMLVALLVLPLSEPAEALDWHGLWQTPDQRASHAFADGDHARAAQTFTDPAWKGAAEFRAGDYEAAAQTLQALDTADAHYNRGNALAKLGRFPEAIAAYGRALTLAPEHEDARHNKELVEKVLEQQEQQKQQEQQDKQESGEEGQKPSPKQEAGDASQEQQQNGDRSGQASDRDQAQQNQEGAQTSESGTEPRAEEQDQAKQAARAGDKTEPEDKREGDAEAQSGEREQQQANEQWLRRIPDDPGGLLRRKFYYQYQQRQGRERRQ